MLYKLSLAAVAIAISYPLLLLILGDEHGMAAAKAIPYALLFFILGYEYGR